MRRSAGIDLAVFWLWLGAVNKRGFLGFVDRVEVSERCLSWDDTFDECARARRELVPEADVDAIASCVEETLAWEPLRQVSYFGLGMQAFEGLVRFAYRDHRRIGGWFVNWLGVKAGFGRYRSVFADFEERAERLLAAAPPVSAGR